MIRKRFFEDLERVARGEDPKAIVRDPKANECIALPVANRRSLVDGLTRAELDSNPFAGPRNYPFQVGQPDDVRHAYYEAMGFTDPPPPIDSVLAQLASAAATVERKQPA
jgi:5,5'-dehydrodivanillate O-demethylase